MIPVLQAAPRPPAAWEPLLLLLVIVVLLASAIYLAWRFLAERRSPVDEQEPPTEIAGWRSLPAASLVAEGEYKRLPMKIDLFTDTPTFIGRDPKVSTAILSNIGISRRHAVIAYRTGDFQITDNNSRGGTYVEHQQGEHRERKRLRGDRPIKLADGDIVLFYKFAYRFHSALEHTEIEDENQTEILDTPG